MFIELSYTLSVIYKRISAGLVLSTCFNHDTANCDRDFCPSVTNDPQRNLIRVLWMQFEENLSNSIIVQLELFTYQVLLISEIITEYELFHRLRSHALIRPH